MKVAEHRTGVTQNQVGHKLRSGDSVSHGGRAQGDRSYETELRYVESPGDCIDVFGQAMKSHSFLRRLS